MPEMTYLAGDLGRPARGDARTTSPCSAWARTSARSAARSRSPTASSRSSAPNRVWDTPLAENAIIGTAVGAAIEGLRPVCEMQFADFIACGFDQLVNVAAKMHYRQGLAVPMVVRLPSGGGFSGGPFHSQNPEAWFLQSPGLKVVAPSTAEDAKGLLAAAIRDPNPVVYMEHKHLYRRVKGEVPEGRYETPIGEARVAREGTDLTVITYGAMVQHRARGDRRPRRRIGRGDRPAHAGAARHATRSSRSVRKTIEGRGAARGHALVRRRRRGGRADRARRRSRTSTARSCG